MSATKVDYFWRIEVDCYHTANTDAANAVHVGYDIGLPILLHCMILTHTSIAQILFQRMSNTRKASPSMRAKSLPSRLLCGLPHIKQI